MEELSITTNWNCLQGMDVCVCKCLLTGKQVAVEVLILLLTTVVWVAQHCQHVSKNSHLVLYFKYLYIYIYYNAQVSMSMFLLVCIAIESVYSYNYRVYYCACVLNCDTMVVSLCECMGDHVY